MVVFLVLNNKPDVEKSNMGRVKGESYIVTTVLTDSQANYQAF